MNIKAKLCILCVSLVLAGCSYFEKNDEERIPSEPPAETIDLTVEHESMGSVVVEEPQQPDRQVLKLKGLSAETAQNVSSSSVEVFSYDDVIAVDQGPSPAPAAPRIISPIDSTSAEAQSFGNSSVEVYPLDEAMQNLFSIGGEGYSAGVKTMPAAPVEPVQRVIDSFGRTERSQPSETFEPSGAPHSLIPPQVEERELKRVYVPLGDGYSLYYEHDAVIPAPQYADLLEQLGAANTPAASNTLSIEGYASKESSITDETQRRIVNLRISMERAFAVAQRLMSEGVPYDNIRIVAWGEDHPAPAQGNMSAEQASRRVEILPLQ